MSKVINVLHCVTMLNRGGTETWVVNLCKCLQSLSGDYRYRSFILCVGPQRGQLEVLAKQLGVTLFHYPMKFSTLPYYRIVIAKLLAEENIHILHSNVSKHSTALVSAAHSARIPSLITIHSTQFTSASYLFEPFMKLGLSSLYTRMIRQNLRYVCRNATCVTAVSQGVLAAARDFCGSDVTGDLKLLYLGTPPSSATDTSRKNIRNEVGVCEDTPLVLHLGSFRTAKNHPGLIDVFRRILVQIPDAHLLMAGDGKGRSAIEILVEETGLGESVSFLGMRSDIHDLMSAADILLFPSIYEGLPITIMEAFACGLPVVASDIPGVDEIVENDVNGLLRNSNDHEGLAGAAVKLLKTPALRRRMGEAGFERFERTFSSDAMLQRVDRLYQELLKKDV